MLTSTNFQLLVRLVSDSLDSQNDSLYQTKLVFMRLDVSQQCVQVDMGN